MFRWIDKEHMSQRGLDLTNYEVVRTRADEILGWLSSANPMPLRRTGGPWPKEWVGVFERWTKTEFHRLTLALGKNYALTKSGENYRLSCDVELPDPEARSWLELKDANLARLLYQLVLEPTPKAPPSPRPITVRETIRGPLSAPAVHVLDSAGEHEFVVPTAQEGV